MARSEGSSAGGSQLPKSEAANITIKKKLPRRQLTLISLLICLNVLLWTSIFAIITSIYLIASDPGDTTNIPTEILTITSSLASIGYIIVHTIFSLKQRIWKHQGRHPSILKRTSYVAVRIAVTLCVLWLLTAGWNMITVARRPMCLLNGTGLAGWEAGSTCVVGRIGVAVSFLALIASFTLFGMLAVLRRPFEAHVFKHGYRDPLNPYPTPIPSRRPSPSRISIASEKFRGRISASTYRSNTSTPRLDIDTQNQTPNSPPTTIHAPSPIRAIGLGIFTSQEQPPPLPAAYNPSRTSSTETPPFVQPTAPLPSLAPPPRMSSLVSPSGFVPLSIPAQFSASAWRAIHPPLKSPLGGREGNKSQPHLPSGPGFSYRNRYSRSSVSLTKPHRISSATPAASVAWSSRSGSTGPGEEGRGSPSSGSITAQDRATASAIAYAILNGTPIPGTEAPRTRTQHKSGHVRRASAPDPRTIAGAAHSEQPQERMAKGWKPQLQDPVPIAGPSNSGTATTNNVKTPTPTPSLSRPHIPRSSSAELLSKFSPDSSPDDNTVNLRRELERQLDDRFASVRKSRSESPLRQMRHSDVPVAAKRMSRMPQDPRIAKRNSDVRMEVGMAMLERERERKGKGKERGRWEFEEVKNKPLPKIAAL